MSEAVAGAQSRLAGRSDWVVRNATCPTGTAGRASFPLSTAGAGTRKRLMIVDDSAMMRLVIESTLKDDPNLRLVGTASNGREALEKLPTLRPDVILLDVEMPEMDGIEFLRRARTRAKVIVLSSAVDRVEAAKAAGADAVIPKPSGAISYDLEARRGSELRQTVCRLLGIEAA